LVGAELAQLASIRERLDKMLIRPEDVSRVLPEAILVRSKAKDKQLTTALTPTVEAALSTSVKRNPQPLVDAIAPVMGPAIRQAIRNALAELTQRINQVLDQSLSVKGLRWRLESWRTGRPLAEIVLSHTLLYRVEQVFLIHKQTGLLLQHVSIGGEEMQDSDMVSSMLSAIQSFVQDSFGTTKDEVLESFQVGELTVDIEQGPQAFLAAVIRGNPPRRLRRVFLEALENIHLESTREFENFKGDTSPFVSVRPYLEECLQTQTDAQPKKSKQGVSWAFRLLALGVGGALAWWGYLAFQENRLWSIYLEQLQAEPGIVIVSNENHLGYRSISGLRDPLAADPEHLLQEKGIDPANVKSHWAPYQALHPQFILARARAVLSPPEGLTLSFADGTLTVAGAAPEQWIADARKIARAIPGVTKFVESSAGETTARETTPVDTRDTNTNARELQRKELSAAKERLEQQSVQFLTDTLDLASGQDTALREATKTIRILLTAAQFTGSDVKVEVIGHADAGGAPLSEQVLGLTRAERVIAELTRNGLTQNDIAMLKARVEDPQTGGDTSGQQMKGKVSFRVKMAERS
jgi:OOP family OmpA-OmpF porin